MREVKPLQSNIKTDILIIPLKDGNWTAIFVYDKKNFGLERNNGYVVQRCHRYYFCSYEEIANWINEDYEKQKAKRW